MKSLNAYINEKYLIDTDFEDDEWVMTITPRWYNYSRTDRNRILSTFKNRYFKVPAKNIGWESTMLIKLSEVEKFKDIAGLKENPKLFELPDPLPIDATDEEIKYYALNHQSLKGDKWEINNLKQIQ